MTPWVARSYMSGAVGLLAGVLALLATPTGASAGATERVSVNSAGNEVHGSSSRPALSADGRFVAFESDAADLVSGDTNGLSDVFVHDRQTGATERVSVDSGGNQGDGESRYPAISADGRFVAFISWATNLVSGDTNGVADVFIHDRQTRITERVSVDSAGNQGDRESAVSSSAASRPAISPDGRFVAFTSVATNLVPGDTNETWDVFIRDRQTGTTERVSVDSAGNQASGWYPAISADGRVVVFLAPSSYGGTGLFVRDRSTGTTERIGWNPFTLSNPSISADGRVVAWNTHYSTVVYDRSLRTSATAPGCMPAISADGRVVAFATSQARVPEDTKWWDVYVTDRQTGSSERVSVDSAGNQGNSNSGAVASGPPGECWSVDVGPSAISADGRVVAFWSLASNLVERDTNGRAEVFVRDRAADAPPMRTNVQPPGTHPAGTTEVTLSLTTHEDATCRYSTTPGVAYQAMTATFATTGGTAHATPVGGLSDGQSYTFYIRCQDAAGNANPDDYPVAISVALPGASPGPTERVSVDSAGNQGNSDSSYPSLSANGRFVAFISGASNLVPGDTNGVVDVFVHDRRTGTTERVNVDNAGNEANNGGDTRSRPAISADGRFVAFSSRATNLVPGDTNGWEDVFVRDRWTGTTERVSVNSAGTEGNGSSGNPSISADGRFVAFESYATNLVAEATNGYADVFVHDRQTGITERVSVDSAGNQGNSGSYDPSLSADGRVVAFISWASNLVPGDTNGYFPDVFVHDRQTGVTERVSVDSAGNQGNGASGELGNSAYRPVVSADGRFVAFASDATNLVPGDTNKTTDVFVHDRQTRTTERVSVDSAGNQGSWGSGAPSISADGRFVAFCSASPNLVAGDTNWAKDMYGFDNPASDVFVHDRVTRTTERVNVDSFANQADGGHSSSPAISANGRFIAFDSVAPNLVLGDTNGANDVFVHDRRSPDRGNGGTGAK